jgi:hypothetical protein
MAISFVGGAVRSTNNGASPVITLPALVAGDCILTSYSVPRAITMVARSSGGTAYTAISSVLVNGNLNFQVFQRYAASTGETTVTCSGTANAQDAVTAVALVFRGTRPGRAFDAYTSTTGTSSRPDGPDVILQDIGEVLVSCVGSLANTATVTAPTSFLNLNSTGATDTRSVTTAMSWVASTNKSLNSITAYSSFTSAAWAGVTVALAADSTTWYPRGVDSAIELLRESKTVIISDY